MSSNSLDSGGHKSLSPTAMTLAQAAGVLNKLTNGRPITVEMLQLDVDSGAPTNADGTLNLVHYAAWLVKEMGHGD
jgi:hypothetical protein